MSSVPGGLRVGGESALLMTSSDCFMVSFVPWFYGIAETLKDRSLSFQVSDPMQPHDAEPKVGCEGERLLLHVRGQAACLDPRLLCQRHHPDTWEPRKGLYSLVKVHA